MAKSFRFSFITLCLTIILCTACTTAQPTTTTSPALPTNAPAASVPATSEPAKSEPVATTQPASLTPKSGGTFVVNLAGDPASFNPDTVADDYNFHLSQNLHCRLVKMNLKNNIVPDLAESWDFSKDGKTITFHLAKKALWHDGKPVTAADVKWTFEKIIKEKAVASRGLTDVVSIDTPDANTVTFTLSKPSALFISTLSWTGTYILPKHLYDDGSDWLMNPANMKPVGCGSFKFVENKPGVSITFEANQNYYYGRPYIDKLIYQIIPDRNTAFQAFVNGELDNLAGGLPPAETNRFDSDPKFKQYFNEGGGRDYLTFNFNDEHFGKQAVREAVALGVDKDQIIQVALKGMGIKSEYYIPFNFDAYLNQDAKCPERDVEKAKQILEKAGYVLGSDGYYFTSKFDIFTAGSSPDIAEVVVQNLKEIGINLEINSQEYAAWADKVMTNKNFSITLLGGQQAPDVSATGNRLVTGGSMNFMNYSNPKVDELYAKGSEEFDVSKRATYYKEAQVYLAQDIPHVPLSDYKVKIVVPAYVMDHAWTVSKAASAEWTYTWLDK